jgi:hypothetical protein
MSELTYDDLHKMTIAEIAKHFGVKNPKPGTTKQAFIEQCIATTTLPVDEHRTETPKPGTDTGENWLDDLRGYLAACTITFKDAGGQVHTVNPGNAHTIALSGFPEAMRTWPAEWADIGGGNIVVKVDDVTAVDARLWHAAERKSV